MCLVPLVSKNRRNEQEEYNCSKFRGVSWDSKRGEKENGGEKRKGKDSVSIRKVCLSMETLFLLVNTSAG